MLLLAQRILDTVPPLNGSSPLPPPLPGLLVRTTLSRLWEPQATLLEVVKDPQPHRPRAQDDIRHAQLLARKEGPLGVSILDPSDERVQELLARLIDAVWLLGRVLQEPVEGRDDATGDIVDRNPQLGLLERVSLRVQGDVWKRLVQVVADDARLDQRLLAPVRGGHAEGGDQPARVERQERLLLLVGVNFLVAVGDALLLEGDPHALHEGAEPARVEDVLAWLAVVGVRLDDVGCGAGGGRVELLVWDGHC